MSVKHFANGGMSVILTEVPPLTNGPCAGETSLLSEAYQGFLQAGLGTTIFLLHYAKPNPPMGDQPLLCVLHLEAFFIGVALISDSFFRTI